MFLLRQVVTFFQSLIGVVRIDRQQFFWQHLEIYQTLAPPLVAAYQMLLFGLPAPYQKPFALLAFLSHRLYLMPFALHQKLSVQSFEHR